MSFLLSAPAAPRLRPIADEDVPYGLQVQISTVASDPDPTATLSYSANVGTIDPKTGVYRSVPITLGLAAQSVTITVSDNATPPHTASQSFTIHPVYDSPVVVVNNHIYYAHDLFGSGVLSVSVAVGQPLVLTGYVADGPTEQPLTSEVNLNDLINTGVGNQPLTLNPDNSFTLSHIYVRPRSFQVLLTVTDSAGAHASAFINVTVIGTATGGTGPVAPPVQVTSITEKVVKKAISEFDVQFDGSVTGANNPANYHLALVTTKKIKKHTVKVSKSIPIKKIIYEPSGDIAEIFPAGKIAPGKINLLTITASGILDSLGRPLDGNHDGQPGGDLAGAVGKGSVAILSARLRA